MSTIICKSCGFHNTGSNARCLECGAMLMFGFIPCAECGGTGHIFLDYVNEYAREGTPEERYLPCAVCGGRGKRDPEVLRREASESRLKQVLLFGLALLPIFFESEPPSRL